MVPEEDLTIKEVELERLRAEWEDEHLRAEGYRWERDRLQAVNSRLRKAVTWLKGALHDESPEHTGPHDTCETWECIRARVVLKETADTSEGA